MSSPTSTIQAVAIALQVGVTPMLWGPPGTGKTSMLRAIARVLGWELVTLVAANRERTDFAGFPVPEGDRVRFIPAGEIARVLDLDQKGRGVLLFLDELNAAPAEVRASLMGILLEGAAGDIRFSPRVHRAAAGNPPEESAGLAPELSPAEANRLLHFSWNPPASFFIEGQNSGWDKLYQEAVPRVPPSWERLVPSVWEQIHAFWNRGGVHQMAPTEESPLAFATPRSWEFLARAYAGALAAEAGEGVFEALAYAAVGPAVAPAWLNHWRGQQIPDPKEILEGVFSLPTRTDQVVAVTTRLAETTQEEASRGLLTQEAWANAWRYLARVAQEFGADAAYPAVRRLVAVAQNLLQQGRGLPIPEEARFLLDELRDLAEPGP